MNSFEKFEYENYVRTHYSESDELSLTENDIKQPRSVSSFFKQLIPRFLRQEAEDQQSESETQTNDENQSSTRSYYQGKAFVREVRIAPPKFREVARKLGVQPRYEEIKDREVFKQEIIKPRRTQAGMQNYRKTQPQNNQKQGSQLLSQAPVPQPTVTFANLSSLFKSQKMHDQPRSQRCDNPEEQSTYENDVQMINEASTPQKQTQLSIYSPQKSSPTKTNQQLDLYQQQHQPQSTTQLAFRDQNSSIYQGNHQLCAPTNALGYQQQLKHPQYSNLSLYSKQLQDIAPEMSNYWERKRAKHNENSDEDDNARASRTAAPVNCDIEKVPNVINSYAQLISKLILLSLIIYVLLSLVIQVKQDLSMKWQTENEAMMLEIQQCAKEYYDNRCDPAQRVRALENFCSEKETCMNKDPQLLNKNTKIMVKLFAEIINDFFEPLSYKSMIFIVIIFLSLFFLSGQFGGKKDQTITYIKKKEERKMKQTLYIDPRIRDNVFFPLILLMMIVSFLRYYITKLMYQPDNPVLQQVGLSTQTLKKTYLEKMADFNKDHPGEIDVIKLIETEVKVDQRESNALARSTRIRKACEYLPEDSVKLRKAFYCKENTGYFNKKVQGFNPLAMNPDMMSNMLKQNVQGMFNIFLFSVVGSFFSGFIIAQVPFPLGQKFKGITQQGLHLQALDPSYVSSMSWCFLLIFGLQGLMSLILGDSEGLDDMNAMMPNPAMMQPQGMEQKNFQALFKSEKENYEILNYKFKLDDAEDAFLAKYQKKLV